MLVRIDPRDYQARVDQAKAALALAEARARGAGAQARSTASEKYIPADAEDPIRQSSDKNGRIVLLVGVPQF